MLGSLVNITRWIILGVIVLLTMWTVFTYIFGVPGDTVSEVVLYYARKYPVLVLALGIVLGHWFWPQN